MVSVTAAGRRDRLAEQVADLERRRGELVAAHGEADQAWRVALEAGKGTAGHADQRRVLAAQVEDVDAELATVRGWHTEAQAQAERERITAELAAESKVFARDMAAFAEQAGRMDAVFGEAISQVGRAAEAVVGYVTGLDRVRGELAARAATLNGKAAMVDQPQSFTVGDEIHVNLEPLVRNAKWKAHVFHQARRGVDEAAVTLAEAVRVERGRR